MTAPHRRPWIPGLGVAAVFAGGLTLATLVHFEDVPEFATLIPFIVLQLVLGVLLARRLPVAAVAIVGLLFLGGMVTMAYTMSGPGEATQGDGEAEAGPPAFRRADVPDVAFHVAPWLFVPLLTGAFLSRRFLGPGRRPQVAAQ